MLEAFVRVHKLARLTGTSFFVLLADSILIGSEFLTRLDEVEDAQHLNHHTT